MTLPIRAELVGSTVCTTEGRTARRGAAGNQRPLHGLYPAPSVARSPAHSRIWPGRHTYRSGRQKHTSDPYRLPTSELETVMTALVPTTDASRQPTVFARNGEVFANSRDVAAAFERRHDDVLRSIRSCACSAEFRARNFTETENIEQVGFSERRAPTIDMTKDGFAFVALGFTGSRAAKFKEAYIQPPTPWKAAYAPARRLTCATPSNLRKSPSS
jgi:Rha family phage regulatory protein